MKKNIGALDKSVRLLAAIIILASYFCNIISGLLAMLLLVIAAGLLLTSLISFCPFYYSTGVRNRKPLIK
jgi:hypothetical protein